MKHGNTNKKQRPEWIAKRVAKQLGKKRTLEFRIGQAKRLKGNKNALGYKHSEVTKTKLSEMTKKQWESGIFGKGEKNGGWKGGISPINKLVRSSKEYITWRTKIFIRDDRKCIWCGSNKDIEADHIIPLCLILEKLRFEQGIENLYEKALNYPLLLDISNGRTLCRNCHKTTPTYCKRKFNY